MKKEKRIVHAQWIYFIDSQPKSERLYLYEGMVKYLFNGVKVDNPTPSLSYLYNIMEPSVSHIISGMKGGKPSSKQ